MENQITIVSKTQMLVVEPNTQSVHVIDAGPIGPIDPLTTGLPGTNAKSAYQIAVDNGFVGTVTQWLASLQPVSAPVPTDTDAVGALKPSDLENTIDILGGIHVTELV